VTNSTFFAATKYTMSPLKIHFKILNVGNGKFLSTKNPVSNLIVDVINKNPSQSSSALRNIALQTFREDPKAQSVLKSSDYFFIAEVRDVEIIINYLPQEKALSDQFYTQWRYVQVSEPYRLIQYLDENRLVVYSEKTRVIHTIKLDKTMTVVVEDLPG